MPHRETVASTALLQKTIKADPQNAAAYDHLGTMLVQQGKLEEVAATYSLLIRNQPNATAHRELAQVLARLGRDDEASRETELAKVLEGSQGAAR